MFMPCLVTKVAHALGMSVVVCSLQCSASLHNSVYHIHVHTCVLIPCSTCTNTVSLTIMSHATLCPSCSPGLLILVLLLSHQITAHTTVTEGTPGTAYTLSQRAHQAQIIHCHRGHTRHTVLQHTAIIRLTLPFSYTLEQYPTHSGLILPQISSCDSVSFMKLRMFKNMNRIIQSLRIQESHITLHVG